MANPVKEHPNASVALTTSGAGAAVVWFAGNVLHWTISAEAGIGIAGALTTVALAIGRNGIKGTFGRIWNGKQSEA